MLPREDFRIPPARHKNSVNATRNRRREHICNLEANQETEGHDNRRVLSGIVISRVREEQVKISKQCAGIANEDSTKGQHWPKEAFLRVSGGVEKGISEETYVD